MDEKDIQYILFTERFQQVYQHLGVFSYLYFLQESRGIQREEFLKKAQSCHTDTEDIVAFLKDQELFTEEEQLLHLNTSLFFSLSVWDLLIRVEPWIQKPPVEIQHTVSIGNQEYDTIKTFAQTHTLSDSYIHPIW